MAVREFDGVDDDIQMAVGGLSGMTYGTVGIILKRTALLATHDYFVAHTSGGTGQWGLYFDSGTDEASWWTGSGSGTGPAIASTSIWYLILGRKASGLSAPRWSVYNFTAATWSHVASGTQNDPGSAPGAGGTIRFSWGGGEFFKGRVAARAAWSNSLPWAANAGGDNAIETAGLEDSYQAWLDNSPTACWKFNQASTSTPVDDDSTTGTADQSSITGTTVITGDDPPGFSFGGAVTTSPILLRRRTGALLQL